MLIVFVNQATWTRVYFFVYQYKYKYNQKYTHTHICLCMRWDIGTDVFNLLLYTKFKIEWFVWFYFSRYPLFLLFSFYSCLLFKMCVKTSARANFSVCIGRYLKMVSNCFFFYTLVFSYCGYFGPSTFSFLVFLIKNLNLFSPKEQAIKL